LYIRIRGLRNVRSLEGISVPNQHVAANLRAVEAELQRQLDQLDPASDEAARIVDELALVADYLAKLGLEPTPPRQDGGSELRDEPAGA
jgi:hypothetical protein